MMETLLLHRVEYKLLKWVNSVHHSEMSFPCPTTLFRTILKHLLILLHVCMVLLSISLFTYISLGMTLVCFQIESLL